MSTARDSQSVCQAAADRILLGVSSYGRWSRSSAHMTLTRRRASTRTLTARSVGARLASGQRDRRQVLGPGAPRSSPLAWDHRRHPEVGRPTLGHGDPPTQSAAVSSPKRSARPEVTPVHAHRRRGESLPVLPRHHVVVGGREEVGQRRPGRFAPRCAGTGTAPARGGPV